MITRTEQESHVHGVVRRYSALVLVGALCACAPVRESTDPSAPSPVQRFRIEDQETRGLSGLTRGPDGSFWAVGERDHVLLALGPADGRTLSRRRITGVDPGTDLESLVWLGDSRFAAGTERPSGERMSDPILIVETGDAGARVTGRWELHYGLWGIRPRPNEGIEGLCVVGTTLLAGIETSDRRDGRRVAPLGRLDMESGDWTPLWLELTTGSGDLSALDCRADGDRIDVLAVERRISVARVLRFSLAPNPPAGIFTPTVVFDLARHKRWTDNFEGIVWTGERSAALILDNDHGGISGRNTLFRVSF